MAGNVFISYRRHDNAKDARAIYERLRREFGELRVFIDLEGIEPGEDFVESLERQLDGCEALVVLIGRDWIDARNEHGERRLDDENDFVRIELGAALRRGVKVFPVLIDGAPPPRALQLPEPLRPLVRRQATVLDYAKFDADVARLARAIRRAIDAPREVAPVVVDEPVAAPAPEPEPEPGPEIKIDEPAPTPSADPPRRRGLRHAAAVLAVLAIGLLLGLAKYLSQQKLLTAAIAEGQAAYAGENCVVCHGPDGARLPYNGATPLNASTLVTGPKAALIAFFVRGPGRRSVFVHSGKSDATYAAVGTYIRNAWGHKSGDLITADEIHSANLTLPVPVAAPESNEALYGEALMPLGEAAYAANCAVCHQQNGKGAGPIKALDGSAIVIGPTSQLLNVLLRGANNGAMPAWKSLSNKDLASIATYIRNHWDNRTGDLVQPQDVQDAR